MKMRRPKQSFKEFLQEKSQDDFFHDLAWASFLAHKVTRGDFSSRKKKKYCDLLLRIIWRRIADKSEYGIWSRWDERHYKPLRRIQKELGL